MEQNKNDDTALRETLRLRAGNSKKGMDLVILTLVIVLVVIGITIIYSASYVQSALKFKDAEHFLKNSVSFAGIGIIAMAVMSSFNYRLLKTRPVLWGLVGGTFVLFLLLHTALGIEANGSLRWVDLKITNIQPSEVAKFTCIVLVSYMASIRQNKITGFSLQSLKNICKAMAIPMIFMALTAIQPAMTTVVIIAFICGYILFVAGISGNYIGIIGGLGVAGVAGLLIVEPYRLERIKVTFDPFSDPNHVTFQALQSVFAISSGGLFGLGLGASKQKYFYLPEAQNDFVFAILAEETGFIGSCLVIALFTMLIFRCLKVANNAQDKFGSLLVSGVTAHIAIQFVLNLMVAMSIFPNTGVGLPFISYGGSSLIILLAEIGVVLNVSKHERRM